MSGHPPTIKHPAFYVASLTAPSQAKELLQMIAEASLRGRRFAPGQRALGQLVHRTERTVRRHLAILEARGWVRSIRRGRTMTTIYRLSRALWGRLTGRPARPYWKPLQQTLTGLVAALGARTRGWEAWSNGHDNACGRPARRQAHATPASAARA